ncbi:MAG: heat-inducible transcriptional repressor HrcA [Actinobacteria bacterium]|nr:heat-inducible transcriptional repressor HrcA [Actinomycetota bacterium]MSY35695.1 heat-inducible transcriptional repressor HrcA [Actinomycetota bacterium]MTB29865.1 heat-inducible transcriptional repressor HrcA [Actinomycetota bacterium]
MMSSRRLEILRAIVDEYVATQEPVGSKSIADRHGLGISPATIRNEMAVLEEEGLITQPHTSAGRIPTDQGYRVFVDKLATVKPLSSAERRAIETFLEGALDLDDVVMRTVRLLADVTKQVAVVQYPSMVKSRVRHIELVALAPARLMMVLITDAGRIEQRVIELTQDVSEQFLHTLRAALNNAMMGHRLPEVADRISGVLESYSLHERRDVAIVISTVIEMAMERPEEKIVLAGTANLARFQEDFSTTMHPVLEALEEQVVLLRLLGDTNQTVKVRIGHEQKDANLRTTSLVAVGYGSDDNSLGALGVIGPTRMDYAGSMAAVSAVARYVGQFINEGA